jgi:phosphopantetheinyl transferase
MIYLVYQNFSSLDPEDLLENENLWSAWEKQQCERLKVPKRRMEWVASRIVIKKLIKAVLPDQKNREMNQIEMHKEPSGSPYIVINHLRLKANVSISHSNGFVLAACSPEPLPLGVDVEKLNRARGSFWKIFSPVMKFHR